MGQRAQSGPWGGGNRFISAIVDALHRSGHSVVYDLRDPDIDIILMTDPRIRSPNVCFGPGAIFRYLWLRNPNAILVHRINECDERKNERFINHKLVRANYLADASVFVGKWLTDLPTWRAHLRSPWTVIKNGADATLFNPSARELWDGREPLRLVTHHWGYHPMKGFDIYSKIDAMLEAPAWKNKIAFTYVGNLPKGFHFRNARTVPPLNGETLAAELSSHHVYVTASINEPGGNHQNEGAMSGLPLLYRASGCMPEYCEGYGVEFAGAEDFERSLQTMMDSYAKFAAVIAGYPWTAERMTRDWISLFENLLKDRNELTARRQLWRNPWLVVANQIAI